MRNCISYILESTICSVLPAFSCYSYFSCHDYIQPCSMYQETRASLLATENLIVGFFYFLRMRLPSILSFLFLELFFADIPFQLNHTSASCIFIFGCEAATRSKSTKTLPLISNSAIGNKQIFIDSSCHNSHQTLLCCCSGASQLFVFPAFFHDTVSRVYLSIHLYLYF